MREKTVQPNFSFHSLSNLENYMQVISTEKLPIKMWLDDLEAPALEQAKNLANLPFAFKHIALMPDSHPGYGMPIGGVLAAKGVVIPNAVGVDIGCGMCAVKTNLTSIDKETIKKIFGGSKENHGGIRSYIPLGINHQNEKQDESLMPKLPMGKVCERQYESALKQIGTLGGGNHFIEIQKGSDGHIWIMIHSGSRNFGLQVANFYNEIAVELNEEWHSTVPKKWELAFLPLELGEGQEYLKEMNYCVEFALANRKLMMERCKQAFMENIRSDEGEVKFEEMINIAHNYASMENHYDQNVLIHRKGATLAREGVVGIIPGSQGTKSYIVKGKGNKESFESCSHGAGRKMGRGQATRDLDLETEKKILDDQGIVHGMRNVKDLDEAAGAYKPIDVVMANQSDLVDILIELTPLGVIKA